MYLEKNRWTLYSTPYYHRSHISITMCKRFGQKVCFESVLIHRLPHKKCNTLKHQQCFTTMATTTTSMQAPIISCALLLYSFLLLLSFFFAFSLFLLPLSSRLGFKLNTHTVHTYRDRQQQRKVLALTRITQVPSPLFFLSEHVLNWGEGWVNESGW